MAHLRVFAVGVQSRRPRASVALTLTIRTNHAAHLVALLATDHVGYASFDLTAFADLLAARGSAIGTSAGGVQVVGLELAPLRHPRFVIDVLEHFRLFAGKTPVLLVTPEDDESPDCGCEVPKYPSVQNPTTLDWRLSPRSFATHARPGQHGCCETLQLSDASVRDYTLWQVVPTDEVSLPPTESERPPRLAQFREAASLHEYRVQWIPQGHALGEILYSLPLAPCEAVQLAVVDWQREDRSRKAQSILFQEMLRHELRRDRSVDEAMYSTLEQLQSGTSLSAGVTGGIPDIFGASFAIASSHQEGKKELAGEAAQMISDSVVQGGRAVRSLTSTVIVEASQTERDAVQTRTIRNHNHCHTLTIQYYEVLRHFLVESRWQRRTDVIIVPVDLQLVWTAELALQYRHILRRALLDPELDEALDALRIYVDNKPSTPIVPSTGDSHRDSRIVELHVSFLVTVEDSHIARSHFAEYPFTISCSGSSDGAFEVSWQVSLSSLSVPDNSVAGAHMEVARDQQHILRPADGTVVSGAPLLSLRTVKEYKLSIKHNWWNTTFSMGGLSIWASTPAGKHLVVHAPFRTVDSSLPQTPEDHNKPLVLAVKASNPDPSPPSPKDTARDAYDQSEQLVMQLLKHLAQNGRHYEQALVTHGATAMVEHLLNLAGLAGHVVPQPIALTHGRVAFPLQTQRPSPQFGTVAHERIVSLPTRGVFAEAMLGQCSSCEQRDVTRFWDWTESPCPDQAPAIAPVNLGSRFQRPDLSTTELPGGVLNIVNPPAAPDPTGLGSAMSALGSASLSDTTSQAIGQALQAASAARQPISPRTVSDLNTLIRNSGLSPTEQNELIRRSFESAIPNSHNEAANESALALVSESGGSNAIASSVGYHELVVMKELLGETRLIGRWDFSKHNILALHRVQFDYGSAILLSKGTHKYSALENLRKAAKFIHEYGEPVWVGVTGFTNESGPMDYNETLARDRVTAVINGLIEALAQEASRHTQPSSAIEVTRSRLQGAQYWHELRPEVSDALMLGENYVGMSAEPKDPKWQRATLQIFHYKPISEEVNQAWLEYLKKVEGDIQKTPLWAYQSSVNIRGLEELLEALSFSEAYLGSFYPINSVLLAKQWLGETGTSFFVFNWEDFVSNIQHELLGSAAGPNLFYVGMVRDPANQKRYLAMLQIIVQTLAGHVRPYLVGALGDLSPEDTFLAEKRAFLATELKHVDSWIKETTQLIQERNKAHGSDNLIDL